MAMRCWRATSLAVISPIKPPGCSYKIAPLGLKDFRASTQVNITTRIICEKCSKIRIDGNKIAIDRERKFAEHCKKGSPVTGPSKNGPLTPYQLNGENFLKRAITQDQSLGYLKDQIVRSSLKEINLSALFRLWYTTCGFHKKNSRGDNYELPLAAPEELSPQEDWYFSQNLNVF